MFRSSHLLLCGAAAALVSMTAPSAGAQSLAVYGTAEASGLGEGSAFLGATLGTGRNGWSPFVSAAVYTFTYRSGFDSHSTTTAFAPEVGLAYQTPTSGAQIGVGYTFLSGTPGVAAIGVPVGDQNSAFVSGQWIYWGNNSTQTQLLGTYTFKGDYLWARASQLWRVGAPSSRFYAGADVTLQGTAQNGSYYQLEIGPAFEYRFSNAVRINGGLGYRTDLNPPDGYSRVGTGYARIGFLWLPPLK